MNREIAKKKAMSRDCRCVKGKDRYNNYNSVIDEIFDWHENQIKSYIDNSYLVGCINVGGLQGLTKELKRLKKLNLEPNQLILKLI